MVKTITRSLMVIGVVSALVGCGAKGGHEAHIQHAANGDLQETTSSIKTLPSFLNEKPTQLKQIYALAAENTELLQWIPCFCGCGGSAGHVSNQNCFIKQMNKDGSVVWDDHGTRCNVCLEIAFKSVQMKQEGKTAKEIRAFIDTTYQKGYAKPTNTPMPQV